MSEINSLRGLNKVSVDFRPTIELNVQKNGNANQIQPEADAVPGDAPLEKANAKSLVQELDVLLLNAAGKSVSVDAAQNVKTVGKSLVDKGVLTKKEVSKLESLAEDAKAKLKALDNFSGRELAKALMQDKKTDETVWSKGFFGMNSVAKAVKAAIEAQQTLSAELAKFNDRLALADENVVDAALQEQFTELQFQCDRRASEIDSVVFRMYKLAQNDVVNGAADDPQTKALLDATFQELMPREAIMMHGTAEAFEKMNANMAAQMRPLAEKLDAFAADGSKVLGKEELLALMRDMATMKNAIAKVRANGIEVTHSDKDGNKNITHTEVDKSLLAEMEKILDEASQMINNAKTTSMIKARAAFLKEVDASLSLLDVPGGIASSEKNATHPIALELTKLKNAFVKTLHKCAFSKEPFEKFDAEINACIAKFHQDMLSNLENKLSQLGADPIVAKSIAKTVNRLHIVKAQFKEMMESTAKLRDADAEVELATSDVRRIMLGEKGLSNVVEAKALGFKPGDVDPAAEEQNIVASRPLGSGAAGKTYLVTTKNGGELVFKPELDSRTGLRTLALGSGSAYLDKQKTANLNLATQDTAKVFGCEDVVVKYSVGNHDGQFGVFMEKAKGYTGSDFRGRQLEGDDGIAPAEMHKIVNASVRTKIKGAIAQKLNKLMWLDLITGQGDRHWENYFVHVDKRTKEVTVKGIDNDASFSARRIGLQKYALEKGKADEFEEELKTVCQKIFGKRWQTEYERRVSTDPALVKNADGSMTIDLAKAASPEIKMAIIQVLGIQSTRFPKRLTRTSTTS